jgi:hypothetical protein
MEIQAKEFSLTWRRRITNVVELSSRVQGYHSVYAWPKPLGSSGFQLGKAPHGRRFVWTWICSSLAEEVTIDGTKTRAASLNHPPYQDVATKLREKAACDGKFRWSSTFFSVVSSLTFGASNYPWFNWVCYWCSAPFSRATSEYMYASLTGCWHSSA